MKLMNMSKLVSFLVALFVFSAYGELTENFDYAYADGETKCEVLLMTANGLQNVGSISVAEYCSDGVTYSLANDVVLNSATLDDDCVTNWNGENAMLRPNSVLDGNNHKISGVCINNDNADKAFLFSVTGTTTFKNINFENIRFHLTEGFSDAASIVKSNGVNFSETIAFENMNLNHVSMKIDAEDDIYVALLLGVAESNVIVRQVHAENIDLDLKSAGLAYVAGFIAEIWVRGAHIDVSLMDNDFNGQFSVSAQSDVEFGSLVSDVGLIGNLIVVDNSVDATVSIDAQDWASVGGLVGYSWIEGQFIINSSSFKGNIQVQLNDGYGIGIGGLVGDFDAYESKIQNSSVSAITGYADDLIQISGSYENVAVGGLVGFSYSTLDVVKSYVLGEISGGNKVGGLIGSADLTNSFNSAFFIGSLPSADNVGGVLGYGRAASVRSGYAIDLSGHAQEPFPAGSSFSRFGYGWSMTENVYVMSGSSIVGAGLPNSRAFANYVGFKLGTEYAVPVDDGEYPPYHITGTSGTGDVLFDVYTNTEGHVAYKADGSDFTSEDFNAIVWPSDWPNNWKLSMSKVYTKDENWVQKLSGEDYDVSGCIVTLKNKNALQNLGTIDVEGCPTLTFELENDFHFDDIDMSQGMCTTNWDASYAKLPAGSVLDGKNHTISGVCVIENEKNNLYLFDISAGATVKNLNFDNVAIAAINSTSSGSYGISIFNAVDADNVDDVVMSLENLSIDHVLLGGDIDESYAYVGTLIAQTNSNANLNVENVRVNNVSIPLDAKQVYAGGVIGRDESKILQLTDVNVSGNFSTLSKTYGWNGGLIGFHVGGISLSVETSRFTGVIEGEGSEDVYMGGIAAIIEDCSNVVLSDVHAEGAENASETLIRASSRYSFVGGLIGSGYNAQILGGSSVKGDITMSGSGVAGGFIGSAKNFTIKDSYFIGSLPNANSYGFVNEAWGGDYVIQRSYAVDLSGKATAIAPKEILNKALLSEVGFGTSLTGMGKVIVNADFSEKVAVNSIAFAAFVGQSYNEGDYPLPAVDGRVPTYYAIGMFGGDELYYGFTGPDQRLAYKKDGSAFTAADLPDEWPSDVPDSWKVSTSDVLTHSVFNYVQFTSRDVVVEGCQVTVKTENGLRKLPMLDLSGCQEPISYKLDRDMNMAGSFDENCESNWDVAYVTITGSLDGNGHSIKNVCLNATDNGNLALFNLIGGAQVKNIGFENVRLSGISFRIPNAALFHVMPTGAPVEFSKISLDNVTVDVSSNTASYVGLLTDQSSEPLVFDEITVSRSSIEFNSSYSAYLGGLVGLASSGINVSNSDVGLTITATGDYVQVGGLVAQLKDGESTGNIKNSNVRATISANGSMTYIGGLAANVNGRYDVENTHFVGSISGTSTRGIYAGGLFGYLSSSTISILNSSAKASGGYANVLVDVQQAESTFPVDVSGWIGTGAASSVTVEGSYVFGSIYATSTSSFAAGFLGNYSGSISIDKCGFVGSVVKTDMSSGIGYISNASETTHTIRNVYVVDVSEKAKSLVWGTTLTTEDTSNVVLLRSVENLQTPVFAHDMKTFYYDPEQNDGFPVHATEGLSPTYKVYGYSSGDVLYDGYTNSEGKFAYKADGTPVSAADLPDEWPSSWPDDWKITLDDIFTQDFEHAKYLNDEDYAVDGCNVLIKGKSALMGLGLIEVNDCSGPVTYKLANDISFGSSYSKSCVSNWDNASANLPAGAILDGDHHKISGVCLNASSQDEVYLFKLASNNTVKNMDFENVVVRDVASGSAAQYVSLFNTHETTGSVTFRDLNFNHVDISKTDGDGCTYMGMLVAYANANMTIQNVHVEDLDIDLVSLNKYVYEGGLVGYINYGTDVSISDVFMQGRVSGNSGTYSSYVGGVLSYENGQSLEMLRDTINLDVDFTGGYSYIGGCIGYLYASGMTSIKQVDFVGSILVDGSGKPYVGGFAGEFSNSSASVNMSDVHVSSRLGSDGTLLRLSGNWYYLGGLVGHSYSNLSITRCYAQGAMEALLDSRYSYQASGLVGYSSGETSIYSSYFIGSIPIPSSDYSPYGVMYSYSNSRIVGGYAIDLSGNTTNAWNQTSKTDAYGLATAFGGNISLSVDGVSEEVPLSSPYFANAMGLAMGPDGYPVVPSEDNPPVVRVMAGIYSDDRIDTLYTFYTGSQGTLAYTKDGSAVTQSDLDEITWPDNWPEEWKPVLGKIYTENTDYIRYFDESDYAVDNCVVTLKTAKSLQLVSKIEVEGCSELTYKLGNDITFSSEELTESCETNWDNRQAIFNGSLDGNGFTISGLCYKNDGGGNVYLFDVTQSSFIKNVNFRNIYVENANSIGGGTSIFKADNDNNAETALTFENLNIESIGLKTSTGYNDISSGVLLNSASRHLSVEKVSVKNANVTTSGNSTALVGGFVGNLKSGPSVFKNNDFSGTVSVTVNSSSRYSSMTGAGLVGRVSSSVTSFAAENNKIDAEMVFNGSPLTYVGGLLGDVQNSKVLLKDNKVCGSLSVTATSTSSYLTSEVGGLLGAAYMLNDFSSVNDTVEMNVSVVGSKVYAGGMYGNLKNANSVEGSVFVIDGNHYKGSVSVSASAAAESYAGGLIGHANSSKPTNGYNIKNTFVESPDGYSGKLVSFTGTIKRFIGGLLGKCNSSLDVVTTTVLGDIKVSSTSGYYYVAGFIAKDTSRSTLNIDKSVFVGSFPMSASKKYVFAGYDISGSSWLTNSYGVNTLGSSTYGSYDVWSSSATRNVGYSNSLTTKMVLKDGFSRVDSTDAVDASLAVKLGMRMNKEYGIVIPVHTDAKPPHHIFVEAPAGILVDAYTGDDGRIAYKPDGSLYTETDLAAVQWPSDWPSDKKVDLNTVYEDDFIYAKYFNEGDFTKVDGNDCRIILNNANALRHIDLVAEDCKDYLGPTFILKHDIVVSSDPQTEGCQTNWSSEHTGFKGTLESSVEDGMPNPVISGICVNGVNQDNVHVLSPLSNVTIQNIGFENIYLSSSNTGGSGTRNVSLFGENGGRVYHVSFDDVTVKGDFGNREGYAAILWGKTEKSAELYDVRITNSNIQLDGSKAIYAGSVIGGVNGYTTMEYVSAFVDIGRLTNASGNIGGLIGGYIGGSIRRTFSVNSSYFVGRLPNNPASYVYGIGNPPSGFSVYNSYAVALNSSATDVYPTGSSYNTGRLATNLAEAQTPEFANSVNLMFDPDTNNALPFAVPYGSYTKNYKIQWLDDESNVLFEAYTNREGRIAYLPDGSLVKAEDAPEGIEIPFDATFTDDTKLWTISTPDYAIFGCNVELYTTKGFHDFRKGYAIAPQCEKVNFKLKADLDFGSTNDENCVNNWDYSNQGFPSGSIFDGENHTISGICFKSVDEKHVHLLNLDYDSKVQNLKIENVRLESETNSETDISLFRVLCDMECPDVYSYRFKNLAIDNVIVKVSSSSAYSETRVGVLLGRTADETHADSIVATNVVFDVEMPSGGEIYAGGLFAGTDELKGNVKNSEIQGSMNLSARNITVGGLVAEREYSYQHYSAPHSNNTVKMSIQADAVGTLIAGGFIGSTILDSVYSSTFEGVISGSCARCYVGGAVGYAPVSRGYASLIDLKIIGADEDGDLIELLQTENSTLYVGGVLGKGDDNNAGSTLLDKVEVRGNVSVTHSDDSNGEAYAFVADNETLTRIQNSRFIGSLPTDSRVFSCESRVSNTYVLTNNAFTFGNCSSYSGWVDFTDAGIGNISSQKAIVFSGSNGSDGISAVSDTVSPRSPKFASLLGGYVYKPGVNDGYPVLPAMGEKPTYTIAWKDGEKLYLDAFTDYRGYLTYFADGTEIAEPAVAAPLRIANYGISLLDLGDEDPAPTIPGKYTYQPQQKVDGRDSVIMWYNATTSSVWDPAVNTVYEQGVTFTRTPAVMPSMTFAYSIRENENEVIKFQDDWDDVIWTGDYFNPYLDEEMPSIFFKDGEGKFLNNQKWTLKFAPVETALCSAGETISGEGESPEQIQEFYERVFFEYVLPCEMTEPAIVLTSLESDAEESNIAVNARNLAGATISGNVLGESFSFTLTDGLTNVPKTNRYRFTKPSGSVSDGVYVVKDEGESTVLDTESATFISYGTYFTPDAAWGDEWVVFEKARYTITVVLDRSEFENSGVDFGVLYKVGSDPTSYGYNLSYTSETPEANYVEIPQMASVNGCLTGWNVERTGTFGLVDENSGFNESKTAWFPHRTYGDVTLTAVFKPLGADGCETLDNRTIVLNMFDGNDISWNFKYEDVNIDVSLGQNGTSYEAVVPNIDGLVFTTSVDVTDDSYHVDEFGLYDEATTMISALVDNQFITGEINALAVRMVNDFFYVTWLDHQKNVVYLAKSEKNRADEYVLTSRLEEDESANDYILHNDKHYVETELSELPTSLTITENNVSFYAYKSGDRLWNIWNGNVQTTYSANTTYEQVIEPKPAASRFVVMNGNVKLYELGTSSWNQVVWNGSNFELFGNFTELPTIVFKNELGKYVKTNVWTFSVDADSESSITTSDVDYVRSQYIGMHELMESSNKYDVSYVVESSEAEAFDYQVALTNLDQVTISGSLLGVNFSADVTEEGSIPIMAAITVSAEGKTSQDSMVLDITHLENESPVMTTYVVAFGESIDIPENTSRISIGEKVSYSIALGDASGFTPLFMASMIPDEYVYGSESVEFPPAAALQGCFTGWNIRQESGDLDVTLSVGENGNTLWEIPESTYGNVIATPQFDSQISCERRQLKVSLSMDENLSDVADFVVKFGETTLPLVNGVVTLPAMSGIELTYETTLKDRQNFKLVNVQKDGAVVANSGSVTIGDEDIEFVVNVKYTNFVVFAESATASDSDIKLAVSETGKISAAEGIPAGGIVYDAVSDSIHFYVGSVNGNATLWDADFDVVYTESVRFQKRSYAVSDLVSMDKPEKSYWDGDDFNVYTSTRMPTVILAVDGEYVKGNTWNYASPEAVKSFLESNFNDLDRIHVNLTLETDIVEPYNLAIDVANIENIEVAGTVLGTEVSVPLSIGNTNVPWMSEVQFTSDDATLENVHVTVNGNVETVALGEPLAIAPGVTAIGANRDAIYTITVIMPEGERIFQVGDAPTEYAYGQDNVELPLIGSTKKTFVGWEISVNGVVVDTVAERDWEPGQTQGDVVIKPLFREIVIADLLRFVESRDTNTILVITYNGDTLDIENGVVVVPALEGLVLDYSFVVKDTMNVAMTGLSMNSEPVGYSGQISIDDDVRFDVSIRDIFRVTFADQNSTTVVKVEEDGQLEDGGKNVPAENFAYNVDNDAVSFWSGVVNDTLSLWDNDYNTVYNQSVTFEKREYIADEILDFELPGEYYWNGSASKVFASVDLPAIVYEENGRYMLGFAWNISLANGSMSRTVYSRDEALEFMKSNFEVIGEGFVLEVDKTSAEDNTLEVQVDSIDHISIVGQVLDSTVEFSLENNAMNRLPMLRSPRFIGGENEVLVVTQFDDNNDSIGTLYLVSGEEMKLMESASRVVVSLKAEKDVYRIASAGVAHSGSAVRISVQTEIIKAEYPVSMIARIYDGDSVVLDTVVSDNVKSDSYFIDLVRLNSGRYYAEIVLDGAGDLIPVLTDEFEIASVVKSVSAGHWNMLSLNGIPKNFTIPDANDGALFFWNESTPVADYLQYQRVYDLDSINPQMAYWLYAPDSLNLMAKVDSVKDSITWNLKNEFSGWNMVANPYPWQVKVADYDFMNPEDTLSAFWRWSPEDLEYKPTNVMDVYEGMWIYTDENRDFTIDAKPVFASNEDSSDRVAASKSGSLKMNSRSWALRLAVTNENNLGDRWNVVGVGSRKVDVSEPPICQAQELSLAIIEDGRPMAKSIKTNEDELSWNVQMNASYSQRAKFSVDGLEQIEALGYHAALVKRGEVIPVHSGESLDIALDQGRNDAEFKVSARPIVAVANSIGNLRFNANGSRMKVHFNLETSNSKHVDVRLVSPNGDVRAAVRDNAFVGEHVVELEKPTMSGIYVLRVSAGNSSRNMLVKF